MNLSQPVSLLLSKVKALEKETKHRSSELRAQSKRIRDAAAEVAQSWSGSYFGYHSELYYGDFEKPPIRNRFSPEWGGINGIPAGWQSRAHDDVKSRIQQLAGSDLDSLEDETAKLLAPLKELQNELVIEISPLHRAATAFQKEKELLDRIEKHKWGSTRGEYFNANLPKQFVTRDRTAAAEGANVPAHLFYEAVAAESASQCSSAEEFLTLSQRLLRQLGAAVTRMDEHDATIAGEPGVPRSKIFIGHGRSLVWLQLKNFLSDRLHLECDEFNEESAAGYTTVTRLNQMLDDAQFAFLIMTAEDKHADETAHARENVIHEAGLFQGRLGFECAIILLEEGCANFSNIHGLTVIPFPRGNIEAAFEKIRRVLERERIIAAIEKGEHHKEIDNPPAQVRQSFAQLIQETAELKRTFTEISRQHPQSPAATRPYSMDWRPSVGIPIVEADIQAGVNWHEQSRSYLKHLEELYVDVLERRDLFDRFPLLKCNARSFPPVTGELLVKYLEEHGRLLQIHSTKTY